MEKDKRKLQNIKGSYLVTLPKRWIDNYDLEKGSQVDVVTTDQGYLEISPEYREKKKKEKDVIKWDDHVIKRLAGSYFGGYGKIEINLPEEISKEKREEFNGFLDRLMNVEIIEENSDRIVLKNFGIKDLEFSTAFRRMYYFVRSMFEDLLEGKTEHLKERDKQVDKFYFSVVMKLRSYISKGEYATEEDVPLIKAVDYRMVSEKVERIADIIKNLELTEEEKERARDLFEYFNKVIECFINNEFEESCELNYRYEELKGKIEKKELNRILELTKDISDLIR